jgi:tetratricopeptide (TPR) repeat protein
VWIYRATLQLAIGQIEAAEADIQRALGLNPSDAHAVALRTIIAVVQNEPDEAWSLAHQTVTAAPDAATAWVALSYAQQARLDLDGARSSLEKAVALAPGHATAWARLAELRSSFGELDSALKAAQHAVALEPGLSRAQTVLGFAFLTQVQIGDAVAAFEKAIRLDQADPLPRLGLGLAKIRQGKWSEGSLEIDIAASLDPHDALIRSYLGKAHFEEKLGSLAAREYDVAKRLDPRDPTPWFYDAIRKQTTNQPVEALRDLQHAIALNDNRAVYRSRLLLDADLAARSASLARIYSDLGFQARALVEGWQAVNTDPANFSAHRFLADSYSVLPRHEIARVSELLQSQLLQPISLTPLQPRLAESNLFLISASGPGALSFNEFTPLFNGDRLVVEASGLWGENGTYAGEGVVSGIYQKLSFSLGASHFESDGFRDNSDQQDDIINAFVQLELSHQTSLQAEYRYRNSERGDLQQRFFAEDFFPGERHREETHTLRLGARHALSPHSTLLGSLIYQDFDASLRDDPTIFPGFRFADFQLPLQAFSVEVQHLFRSSWINVISGAGYINSDGNVDTTFGLDLPPPPDGPGPIDVTSTQSTDVEHVNVYAYAHLNLLKDVTFTVGASFDALSGAEDILPEGDQQQFNPKFGVIWQPRLGTTLRAAAFRVLKRELVTDQTLEPTQVAGFNQFYDDVGATDAWRYGLAIDQKFTDILFGGAEMSKRDLEVPVISIDPATGDPTTESFDAEAYLGRAYLYWAPHARLALKAEYIFERFENELVSGEQPLELDTHRVPLGINLFHPAGVNASLTATYWHQDGEFERPLDRSIQAGNTDFWTVDAAIHYRLPKRYGFITIGATNLFDEAFRFYNTDFDNLSIIPDRRFFARVTLALP